MRAPCVTRVHFTHVSTGGTTLHAMHTRALGAHARLLRGVTSCGRTRAVMVGGSGGSVWRGEGVQHFAGTPRASAALLHTRAPPAAPASVPLPAEGALSASCALGSVSTRTSLRDLCAATLASALRAAGSAPRLPIPDIAGGADAPWAGALRSACAEVSDVSIIRSRHADYQTNVAMILAKQIRAPPAAVAATLVHVLQSSPHVTSLCARITHEAGFINLHVSDAFSQQQLAALVASPYARAPRRPNAERVLVDFGSPNMGKELHVGHLRSSVVGDTIARLLEFLGHDVTRLSHVGDAGLPIAIVLAEYFMRAFGSIPRGASDAQLRTMLDAADAAWMRDADAASPLPSAHELSSVYESAKRQMDTAGKAAAGVPSALADAHAAARATHFAADAQQLLRDLQAVLAGSALPEGASPAYAGFLKHAWTQLCAASRAGYEPLFQRLGVQVTEAGESTYADGLASVVEELQRSGVATLSDGALVLFVDGADKSPLLIRKADGGFLYATTDLVCLRRRLESGFTRIVYITDQSQAVHFRQVFAAARMAGWITPDGRNALSRDRLPVSLEHAYFGVVTGEGGRKLSSRDGTPHTLASLLAEGDAAATRACLGAPDATAAAAAAATANTGSEATSDAAAAAAAATGGRWTSAALSAEEVERTARAVASSAVRYFDLSHNRRSPYGFSMARALSLKGNTAAYALYATTRSTSLRRQLQRVLLASADVDAEGAPTLTWLAALQLACDHAAGSSTHGSDAQRADALATWLRSTVAVGGDMAPEERALLMTLLAWPEVAAHAASGLLPNALADYTYDVATRFHSFYEAVRIVPADSASGFTAPAVVRRWALCAVTERTLAMLYSLVGIQYVARM